MFPRLVALSVQTKASASNLFKSKGRERRDMRCELCRGPMGSTIAWLEAVLEPVLNRGARTVLQLQERDVRFPAACGTRSSPEPVRRWDQFDSPFRRKQKTEPGPASPGKISSLHIPVKNPKRTLKSFPSGGRLPKRASAPALETQNISEPGAYILPAQREREREREAGAN